MLSQAVRNAVRAVLALGFVFQLLRFLLGLVPRRGRMCSDEI